MKIVSFSDQRFGITSDGYSNALASVSRRVPGMAWSASARAWVGYPDAVALTAGKLARMGLAIEGDVPDPLIWPDVQAGVEKLHNYQRHGVGFLTARRRCILADDMGLGKSATAIHALANVKAARTVIVCPSYVRPVWVSELAKWRYYDIPIFLPKGCKPDDKSLAHLRDIGIIIIHYDILPGWAAALAGWPPDAVVFDEAHLLSNEKSQRSKAARAVSAAARYVWGLTGTPLTNRPSDLWNLVDTICPGRFGKFFVYGIRYCNGHQEQIQNRQGLPQDIWIFKGSSYESELAYRLQYFMLRRIKSEVSLELPSLTRRTVPIEIKRAPRMMPDPFASAGSARAALDAAANAKVEPCIKFIRGSLEDAGSDRKAVVFTWRRAVAEQIAGELGGLLVHGGISGAHRGKTLNIFREGPGARVLVATIDSTGTGIDLTCAHDAYVVELTWEPHELLQMESRLHRYGAKMPVMISYLIAPGTVDEIIAATVIAKLATSTKIIGKSDAGMAETLGAPEIDPLVALQRAWLEKSNG